jgi:hypothetical protein
MIFNARKKNPGYLVCLIRKRQVQAQRSNWRFLSSTLLLMEWF